MNKNAKVEKMFFKQREERREKVAKTHGRSLNDCDGLFRSYPADKRVK